MSFRGPWKNHPCLVFSLPRQAAHGTARWSCRCHFCPRGRPDDCRPRGQWLPLGYVGWPIHGDSPIFCMVYVMENPTQKIISVDWFCWEILQRKPSTLRAQSWTKFPSNHLEPILSRGSQCFWRMGLRPGYDSPSPPNHDYLLNVRGAFKPTKCACRIFNI